jgi:SAM-dependent methyltransferase
MTARRRPAILAVMHVVELREFYASRIGNATRRLIAAKLALNEPLPAGACIMGLGYAAPYLDIFHAPQCARLAFMPARQGVIHWPAGLPNAAALVDEFDLPLLESTVDIALLIHALEVSDDPAETLEEVWRVLTPQGRLLLVVPNRRGWWARSDASPFGNGQPFSGSQLMKLLKDARFTISHWQPALFLPPSSRSFSLSAAPGLEAMGRRVLPGFSGVIVVEAVKQVYAFSAAKRGRRLAPRLQPALLPSPAQRDICFSGAGPYEGPSKICG